MAFRTIPRGVNFAYKIAIIIAKPNTPPKIRATIEITFLLTSKGPMLTFSIVYSVCGAQL